MDLVREILIRTDSAGFGGVTADSLASEAYDKAAVAYHFQLLHEAGLLEANLLTLERFGAVDGTISRLTWSGHEFLDATRSDTVWKKTKSLVGKQLGTAPFDIILEIAKRVALGSLGLGS
jgi:hypothetical protein